jgi:hypothetical protein
MRHELVTKINKGEERTISIKLAKLMPGTKAAPVHPKTDPMPEKKSAGPKLSIAIAGGNRRRLRRHSELPSLRRGSSVPQRRRLPKLDMLGWCLRGPNMQRW